MKGQRKVIQPVPKVGTSTVKKKGCGCGKWKKAIREQG